MPWEIEATDEFVEWWHDLGQDHAWAVPLADDLYAAYLAELQEEGLL
jgi:hypothetical protein